VFGSFKVCFGTDSVYSTSLSNRSQTSPTILRSR
jgi:hypothetical protein